MIMALWGTSPKGGGLDVTQHTGPNEVTYKTGSPISTATIHGQRPNLFRSSLMPEVYRETTGCGKGDHDRHELCSA